MNQKLFSKEQINRLIRPLIIEQILAVIIGMADTIMVSSCGEAAVSGVSLIDGINVLILNIFAALATGGAIVVSQYIGKEDYQKAQDSATQLVASTLFLSIIIAAIAMGFNQSIITFIFGSIDAEVLSNASIYFLITALSYPFISLYNAGAAIFRSQNNSKISMNCSLFMNTFNIIGNALLIYGLQMGVMGAALSTLLARILGSLFMLHMLTRPNNQVSITNLKQYRPNFPIIKSILQVGIPSGLENSMFHVGKLLVSSLVATFGTGAIAAVAVGNNVMNMACIPETAIGLAMIGIIGQCIGAGEKEQAKYYTKLLLKKTYFYMVLVNVSIILCAPLITSLYSLEPSTTQLAKTLIYIYCANAMIWIPIAFALPNGLRAAGDAKFTMFVAIGAMWICRVGLSYFFALTLKMGVIGVWWAMICDWIFRFIFFTIRYFQGGWLNKRVI